MTAEPASRNVVVLLDSLNRHMLGSYGGREFATPNLDAFA
jgi:arylsulfatase A-like enzyme